MLLRIPRGPQPFKGGDLGHQPFLWVCVYLAWREATESGHSLRANLPPGSLQQHGSAFSSRIPNESVLLAPKEGSTKALWWPHSKTLGSFQKQKRELEVKTLMDPEPVGLVEYVGGAALRLRAEAGSPAAARVREPVTPGTS